MKYTGFTGGTAEKLLLDAGAFFRNYDMATDTFETAVTAGKLLGATRGGGQFSAIPEIRDIEVDGVNGKAKGLQSIDAWAVKMSANLLEVTKQVLADALGASSIDESGLDYDVITAKSKIELTDYIDNITFVGKLSGSTSPVIIQIFNVMNVNGLTVQTQPKNEAVVALDFEGHFDPDTLEEIPFKIHYPKPAV